MMLLAAIVEIGILTLFHPERVTIKPLSVGSIIVEADRVNHPLQNVGAIGARAVDGKVDWFAANQLHSARQLRLSGPSNRPFRFQIVLENGFKRKFEGVLVVRAKLGLLQLVLQAEQESIVARIVAAESPPNSHPEALQAMAVIARSWLASGLRRHADFAYCDSTHCQHLKGDPAPEHTEAVAATAGQVLLYNGKRFLPQYSASVGGESFTAADVGWNAADQIYPFFRVACPICQKNEALWQKRFQGADADAIRARPNKESTRLLINRERGWSSLPSNNYEIEDQGREVLVKGKGRGHGVGYCQSGGDGLARQGWSHARILQHYFPGTSIH